MIEPRHYLKLKRSSTRLRRATYLSAEVMLVEGDVCVQLSSLPAA